MTRCRVLPTPARAIVLLACLAEPVVAQRYVSGPRWEASVGGTYESWNDGREPRREPQMTLRRNTDLGVAIARASRIARSGVHDERVELEAYPVFRGGYGMIGASYGTQGALYARSTVLGEIFVILPSQFETSAGYRRLNFADAVNVFTGSIGKYYREYLFVGRLTRAQGGATGTSGSLTARRYFGDAGQYIGAQAAAGSIRENVQTSVDLALSSRRSVAVDSRIIIGRDWLLTARAEVGRDALSTGASAVSTSGALGVGIRF